MDTRHDHKAGEDPPMPAEAELRAAMARSDEDVAAGRTVPLEEVLADLDASIARMEARRRARGA
jgi:predicted transcriptional regulator